MSSISVLSLNLWNVNQPYQVRMERVATFLSRCKPDLVCLQEVSPYNGAWQSDDLALRCGYSVYRSFSGSWEGRPEGLAILTKGGFNLGKDFVLPEADDDMPRIAQSGFLQSLDGDILVVNTHLAYHPQAEHTRVEQAKAIVSLIHDRLTTSAKPIVFCADLNDTPSSKAARVFTTDVNLRLQDAWAELHRNEDGLTFTMKNPWCSADLWPERRIDFVLYRGLRPQSCRRIFMGSQPDDLCASDHYGVFATFTK